MRPLQRGDAGDEVTALQRILQRAGLFRGTISGNFLDLTKEAVVGFQRLHNGARGKRLPATGIVTGATWWALQHLDQLPATEQHVGWATGLGNTDVGGRDRTR